MSVHFSLNESIQLATIGSIFESRGRLVFVGIDTEGGDGDGSINAATDESKPRRWLSVQARLG